ncbi:MAG: repressor LexA [Anaerolineae bacterium]|nr:MAG: repressor LexA [Anaerolineae bacterium]
MMMARKKKGLSDRHLKILEVMQKYQDENGYPPSIREIGRQAKISSTSVVNYYLDQLEEAEYIQRDRKVSRGMRLLKTAAGDAYELGDTSGNSGNEAFLTIPLAGRIGAGIMALPASDFNYFDVDSGVDVARSLLPEDTSDIFAVEVDGESMIDAMINDGDIVVMRHAKDARNGEMVAVRLADDDTMTLKYFYKEGGRVRLQPANPTMEPIYVDNPKNLEIQGKVLLVIRQVGASPI